MVFVHHESSMDFVAVPQHVSRGQTVIRDRPKDPYNFIADQPLGAAVATVVPPYGMQSRQKWISFYAQEIEKNDDPRGDLLIDHQWLNGTGTPW